MTYRSQLSPAVLLLSVGLIVAGLGILILYIAGVPGFPKIPPGPIILIGAGLLVALLPWRWVSIIGLVVAIFVSVGFVANAGSAGQRLSAPGEFGPFIGTVVQVLGLVVALIASVVATVQVFQSRTLPA